MSNMWLRLLIIILLIHSYSGASVEVEKVARDDLLNEKLDSKNSSSIDKLASTVSVKEGSVASKNSTSKSSEEKKVKQSKEPPCIRDSQCPFNGKCKKVDGVGKCTCPVCSGKEKKICGSDGEVYDGPCFMKRASCLHKMKIKSVDPIGCSGFELPSSKSDRGKSQDYDIFKYMKKEADIAANNKTEVQVIIDDDESMDSKSLEDDEAFSEYNLDNKPEFHDYEYLDPQLVAVPDIDSVVHSLRHETTDDTAIDFAPCPYGQIQRGKCICYTSCSHVYRPVCGTNGVTYDNNCLLEAASCMSNIYIVLQAVGPCHDIKCGRNGICGSDPCKRKICPKSKDPVCASDGRIYRNQCIAERIACLHRIELRTADPSFCHFQNHISHSDHTNSESISKIHYDEEYYPITQENFMTYGDDFYPEQDVSHSYLKKKSYNMNAFLS